MVILFFLETNVPMERSITCLRASTNICCIKSTSAQQGERGEAQTLPLESMVKSGDALGASCSTHRSPALCRPWLASFSAEEEASRAQGMGLLTRLIVSAVNMMVFFPYSFRDILPRLCAMKIESCHRALGWRAGE